MMRTLSSGGAVQPFPGQDILHPMLVLLYRHGSHDPVIRLGPCRPAAFRSFFSIVVCLMRASCYPEPLRGAHEAKSDAS